MTSRVLGLLAVVACGSPAPAPTTPVVATQTPTASSSSTSVDAPIAEAPPPSTPPPVLDIAPATLSRDGDHGEITALDANGYLSLSRDKTGFLPVLFARLTANGELLRPDGTTLLTIDDAGHILLEGKDYGFRITRDGTAFQRNARLDLAIAEDGTVSGTDPKTGLQATDPSSHYVGPPTARQALILATITWAAWLHIDAPEAVAPGKATPTSIAECDAYRTVASKALACVRRDKDWTEQLWSAIARVDGYATNLPPWGRDATASACSVGAARLKAYFAMRKCAL